MKKRLFRLLVLVMIALMVTSSLTACTKKKNKSVTTTEPSKSAQTTKDAKKNDTLVVGYDNFSNRFNPFFSQTVPDQDVANITSVMLLPTDRGGNIILKGIEGETEPYNGKDYTYHSIADAVITQNDDGSVDYDITLKDGVKFSDGEPLTVDDVIFSMYVMSDPTYDGGLTFNTLPIKGMEDYRSGMESVSNLILAAGKNNKKFKNFTEEQQKTYWDAMDKAGVDFVQDIIDYCKTNYADSAGDVGNSDVALGMYAWGYGTPSKNGKKIKGSATGTNYDTAKVTTNDYWTEMQAKYAGDYQSMSDKELANTDLFTFLWKELGDRAGEFQKGISTGNSVANIAGITKTGDNTLRVSMTKFDTSSIYQLALPVAPFHYYGSKDAYNYDNNQFGFTKGDLSGMKAKNMAPLGAGPYVFKSYENGVVTFTSNDSYFEGAPKIKNLLFKETSEADKLTGVASGTFDITDPSLSSAILDSIKKDNSNGDIKGDVITTNLVDNLGYGYLGINAKNVSVGGDQSSDASKNLRKGFATLFAAYRDTVIQSYYGEMASVIQYPISNTSWAAPKPTDDGYALAYAKDVEGKDIYTSDMTEQQKYEAALNASIGYFKAAGYTWNESKKTFSAAPKGAALSYEIIIPGGGSGDHPAYGILTAVKDALASIGITLQINDPSDSNVLWNSINAGTIQFWVAAWQATPDPDLYQTYYSKNVVENNGGTKSNNYHIQDTTLDNLIMKSRGSADQNYRKSVIKDALSIILDWGVEVPLYQRKNAIIFSSSRVNMDTVTPDITPFYNWYYEIQNMEMN